MQSLYYFVVVHRGVEGEVRALTQVPHHAVPIILGVSGLHFEWALSGRERNKTVSDRTAVVGCDFIYSGVPGNGARGKVDAHVGEQFLQFLSDNNQGIAGLCSQRHCGNVMRPCR